MSLSTPPQHVSDVRNGIPYRRLGRTGEMVSLVGVGGYHLGRQADEQKTIRIVRTAVDNGINFLDNCWDYNGGASEIRMGKALRDGYRDKAFLMTKIDGRNKESAARQIDESLRRLQTDRIDLMQFHEVIRMTDPERVFGADGALEAVVAAQRAGKIRYVGFTGHKSPAIHLRMLDTARAHGFRFDAVQMPLNVMDAHYDSFVQQVVPWLVEQDIGVLGMKPLGDPFVLASGGTWSLSALSVAAIGIARNTPGTPQMNHQNNTHTITASGLSFSRPAYTNGDTTLLCSSVMAR